MAKKMNVPVSKPAVVKKPVKKIAQKTLPLDPPGFEMKIRNQEEELLELLDPTPVPSLGGKAKNLVVQARAGTGKTFTLVLSVAWAWAKEVWGKVIAQIGDIVPSPQQKQIWEFIAQEKPRTVTYIAFNKSIVKDFSVKWAWLVAVLNQLGVSLSFSTIHSLGYSACSRAYKLGWGSVVRKKVRLLICQHWDMTEDEVWQKKNEQAQCIENVIKLCKLNLAHTMKGSMLEVSEAAINEIMDRYDIDRVMAPHELKPVVDKILNLCRLETSTIDFDDQIWLPIVNNLNVTRSQLLIVDEGQDLNPCQQQLALKAGDRIALVGDEAQAIYAFAGADSESIMRMRSILSSSERGVEVLRLTQTRRCGKAIVKLAQEIVPDFEYHESNPEGKITDMVFDKVEENLKIGDMLLCRVNAPLVALAFKMIRSGKRVRIQGRDLSQDLKWMIKRSKTKEVADFLDWLDEYSDKEIARLRKKKADEMVIVGVTDKVETLKALCDGAFTLKQVYENIDLVFAKTEEEELLGSKDVILLSSIHRSKGLEADRVFIHRPDLMPHPMAKTVTGKQQEQNLIYVARTRAIHELVHVIGGK